MPAHWTLSLLIADGPIVSGPDEERFFRLNTPQPRDDALLSVSAVWHGLAPAIVEDNLYAFARALRQLQSLGLKNAEIAAQSPQTTALLASHSKVPRQAYGLSSNGPVSYERRRRNGSQPFHLFMPIRWRSD
jgi:predicted sugar kinase